MLIFHVGFKQHLSEHSICFFHSASSFIGRVPIRETGGHHLGKRTLPAGVSQLIERTAVEPFRHALDLDYIEVSYYVRFPPSQRNGIVSKGDDHQSQRCEH